MTPKTSKITARTALGWLKLMLCGTLIALVAVGCRAPLTLIRTGAAGGALHAAATQTGPVDDGIQVKVGPVVDLPGRSASSELSGDGALPSALVGKPYGAVSVSLTWPARPKFSTQTIPTTANALRFRIIGNDGKDRLAVWFFRPPAGNLAPQNQIFFLPVETGMFVEVRAYAQTQSQVTSELATPPYNPPNMPDYSPQDATGTNFRVLAEGLQFDFAVTLLKSTPVQVTMDNTQLVAGIGGGSGFNYGGDPYFGNFLEDARFAEMTLPGALFHDHYGPINASNLSLGQRDRLLFLEYPTFVNESPPSERDLVQILTTNGLEGNADNPASNPFPQPVMLQMGGGSAPISPANGDGNLPAYAVVTNPTKLTYSTGTDTLYVLEASTSASLDNVRILTPATSSAQPVASLGAFDGYSNPSNPQGLIAISNVPGQSNVIAADRASRVIYIADQGSVVPTKVAGGGTATPSITATPSLALAISPNLQSVAASSSSDFLVLDGSTVIRSLGGQARIVAGAGPNAPSTDPSDANANNLSFGPSQDLVYDSTQTYAYVADEFDQTIYRLGPMPASLATNVPFLNIPVGFQPVALAPSLTNSNLLYVLSADGHVHTIDNPGSVGPTPGTTVITLNLTGATYNGLVCGKTPSGTDELFISTSEGAGNVRWANPATGITHRLFGGAGLPNFTVIATPDIAVGDGANLATAIVAGPRGTSPVLTGTGYLNDPTYLTADSTGDIYIADTKNDRIREIQVDPNNTNNPQLLLSLYRSDSSTNPPTVVVNQPQGVDVDEYGDVFVSNSGYNKIDVWRPHCDPYETTSEFSIAGTGAVPGGFDDDNINARLVELKTPTAIRVERHADPTDGTPSRRRVFFIDSGNKRVRMLTPEAPSQLAPGGCGNDPYFKYIISTVAGGGTGGDGTNAAQAALNNPVDISLASNGYLYIADGANIRRVDPVTGSISTIYTASGPLGSLSVDDVKGEIYFTLAGQQTIRKILLPQ